MYWYTLPLVRLRQMIDGLMPATSSRFTPKEAVHQQSGAPHKFFLPQKQMRKACRVGSIKYSLQCNFCLPSQTRNIANPIV